MKYGIITDVHSNIIALKEVLKRFEKYKVDKIICCGDIIGIGYAPEETVQELINLKDKLVSVTGNHEGYLLNGFPKEIHDNKKVMSQNEILCHKWNHGQLSESSKKYLSNLKDTEIISEKDIKICVVHYPMDEENEYKTHVKNPSLKECEKLFYNYEANVFLYGHTHVRNIVNGNGKYYINVGSLGCPDDTNIAYCGILNIEKGNINYYSLDVEYDVDAAIKEIKRKKYPMSDKMLEIFYGGR